MLAAGKIASISPAAPHVSQIQGIFTDMVPAE